MIYNLSHDQLENKIADEVNGIQVRELGYFEAEKLQEEGLDLIQLPALLSDENNNEDEESKQMHTYKKVVDFDRRFVKFFIDNIYNDEENLKDISYKEAEILAISTYFRTFRDDEVKNLSSTTIGGAEEDMNTAKTAEKSKDS